MEQHLYISAELVYGMGFAILALFLLVLWLAFKPHPRWLTENDAHDLIDDAELDEPQITGDDGKVPLSVQYYEQAHYWRTAFIEEVMSRVNR